MLTKNNAASLPIKYQRTSQKLSDHAQHAPLHQIILFVDLDLNLFIKVPSDAHLTRNTQVPGRIDVVGFSDH